MSGEICASRVAADPFCAVHLGSGCRMCVGRHYRVCRYETCDAAAAPPVALLNESARNFSMISATSGELWKL